jgi:serine/threonine-protein kinase
VDIKTLHPFGRYRLVGVLASGGMARLVLALMTGVDGFSRVVAVKQVLPHLVRSTEFVDMFLKEAHLAAKLDHPNIVRIHELGQIAGQYFISMEYLPAEDLARIIMRSRKVRHWVPIAPALTIVQHVCEALQFAHDLEDDSGKRLGLVHRDISPSNILVTYHGIAKLADFGIAKATAIAGDMETRAGVFKGKFAYASPEQVRGQDVDSRSDVFSLGIVLWELLTLRRLFKREHEAATVHAVVHGEIPPLKSIRPETPALLEKVVAKALAREPGDRFQTAMQLHDAIDDVLRKSGASASPKQLRDWLTELFGDERASLKKSIAQGRGLEADGNDGRVILRADQAAILGLKPIGSQEAEAMHSVVSGEPEEAADTGGSGSAAPAPKPRKVSRAGPVSKPQRSISNPTVIDVNASSAAIRSTWSMDVAPGEHNTSSDVPASREFPVFRDIPSPSSSSPGIVPPSPFSIPPSDSGSWGSFSGSGSHTAPVEVSWPRSVSRKMQTRGILIGALAGCLIFTGFAYFVTRGHETKAGPVGAMPQLAIASDPNGASISLDGKATGQITPARLRNLPTKKLIKVRLLHEGYAPYEEEIEVPPASEVPLNKFVKMKKLVRAVIQAQKGEIPVLDGKTVDVNVPIEVPVGRHDFKLLKEGKTVRSKQITVDDKPGQTIDIGDD